MARLKWKTEARDALGNVPFFVRPLARRKIEERVREAGRDTVTIRDYREAEAKFKAATAGKSSKELEQMMPQENAAEAQLVIVQVCRSELSGCPNVLLNTDAWRKAVEAWVTEREVSERLRARVAGERVLFHHKLRISIAGCPNGCSRPQIADLALVGSVRPSVDAETCTACGACAGACPDTAITVDDAPPAFDRARCQGCTRCRDACPADSIGLSEPRARVLMGGKLGRHPHLADVVGTANTSTEAIAFFDDAIDRYLQDARPGERFSAWWVRQST